MSDARAPDGVDPALLTKLALHDLMVTYCRGVDRLDANILATVWHDDATVDAGVFRGSRDTRDPSVSFFR